MKCALFLCPAFLLLGSVRANMIPLSGVASTTASGSVTITASHGGASDSYHFTQSAAAPFATFTGNVTGTASATAQPQPGWTYFLPLEHKVSSSAAQTTGFGANQIAIDGSLFAGNWPHAQVGALSAHAHSIFDVIFHVDDAMAFSLLLDANGSIGHGNTNIPPPVFSLTALAGGLTLGMGDVVRTGGSLANWHYYGTGLLAPGDYRLIYNLTAFATTDPLGDSNSMDFTLRLNAAPVPDGGATILLLAIVVAVLGAWRRLAAA